MDRTPGSMTIGALAAAAGVNVESIRFYQRSGLIAEPERPPGGIRRYGPDTAARVRFIKAAQRLGFSLDEVGELLALEDGTHCSLARELAQRKLEDVREKLAHLRRIDKVLAALVARCAAADGEVACPLIDSLQRSAKASPATDDRPGPGSVAPRRKRRSPGTRSRS